MMRDLVIPMTVVHVVVLGGVAALVVPISRLRHLQLPRRPARAPAALMLAGLALMALILTDGLLGLDLLLPLLGAENAQGSAFRLFPTGVWLVTYIPAVLVCAGLVLDLRAHRKSLSVLRSNEERYRSIVQDQSDFIVRWLPGGIRTWVNEPYCKAFGQPREALIGTSRFTSIAEPDRKRIQNELAGLSRSSPSRSGIHQVELPNGELRWQEWTDRGLFDESGQLMEIQSVGRDITDRIRTEEALERSEARFRGIIENTSDWIWELDSQGRHVYSNRRVECILGYTREELYGLQLRDLVHPEDLESIEAELPNIIRDKCGWQQWIIRFRRRDGSYRYLESTADPILDDDGNVVGHRGIDRDTTVPTLLSRISSSFVGIPANEVDEVIERVLGDIGPCYGIERISFWWVHGPYVLRSHEWARAGMEGSQRFVLQENVPLAFSQISEGTTFKVESLDELPADAKERSFLAAQGVKSTMALPMFTDSALIGVAVFSTVSKARKWAEATESELRVLAERIGNAYTQSEKTRAVHRRERDLIQSEALARVGSFAYHPYTDSARFPDEWKAEYSQELCRLYEIDPGSASFDLFMSRIHPDDRKTVREGIDRLLTDGRNIELEYRIQNPSGAMLYLANRTLIDRDDDGRDLRILGAVRDITDQVNRQNALKEALQEIEQLRDRLEAENVKLREEISTVKGFDEIVGDSDSLRKCLNLVTQAAPTDASILILGETGTGKELIAKAVHGLSARRDKPLVSLNCTALPAGLVESELFGHERGAFTGAHSRRAGRFEIADGGTLFLDEIGELPMALQGRLLRALQDGSFQRVGGSETIHVDVRLIAATNRNLREAVDNGEFRADLYYRINTVPIHLPALRERRGDIPLLAQHFVNKHGRRLGKSVEYISAPMLSYLQNQDWPGNIRELEHAIERALISSSGNVLTLTEIADLPPGSEAAASDGNGMQSAELRIVERDHIVHVLEETGWTIGGEAGAAARLRLPPSTLRSKMKRLGIRRPT